MLISFVNSTIFSFLNMYNISLSVRLEGGIRVHIEINGKSGLDPDRHQKLYRVLIRSIDKNFIEVYV
jgi:hypothetical protein